ncbi:MAG TPA: alanine--tRNA ligase [Caldisericia bacterium]|nr:alanine--tRNA ligase [Caldisericia bacterium]
MRKEFLDFFESNEHLILPSFSLIPKDPTLLFTAAGMVPLKSYFLGEEEPPKRRIATCQKCLRTNDIEQVGKTIRHHTFFEMLGNFSIGDYFKEDAILWAYELLTKNFGLNKEKIWVSIYPDDDEALKIWKKVGISEEMIVKLEDNFWQMGEEGPCGPDSELYYDLGEDFPCKDPSLGPLNEGDRFLEVWNLVFTQFDRKKDGSLDPLPRKNIDTGMGLERITMILQNKKSNFETDLFSKIIESIKNNLNVDYNEENKINIRVIADHIRAITFLINENLFPSNEGRGYVLRRLIRRSFSSGWSLGARDPFLYKIYPSVIETFSGVYDLKQDEKIIKILHSEEKNFIETLSRGLDFLYNLIDKAKKINSNEISGKDIFFLYDTYGFPPELSEDILSTKGLNYNKDEFNYMLDESRKKSRTITKESRVFEENLDYIKIKDELKETEFLGYDTLSTESKILLILKNGERVNSLKEKEEGIIILDKTPFYGEKGGQVGDRGIIKSDKFEIEIYDTKSPVENLIIHFGKVIKGEVFLNDVSFAIVDKERRESIKRAHTATHLLHKALITILGEHATQKGSFVSEDFLRFDFSHFSSLTEEEIDEIEKNVNLWIYKAFEVSTFYKNIDEAKREGAIALFGEKYGNIVRVVKVDELSKEFCGGTHVSNTIEIGCFKIISERGIGTNLRRIEAVTGLKVIENLKNLEKNLNKLESILSAKGENLINKITELKNEIKNKEDEIHLLKTKYFDVLVEKYIKDYKLIDDIKLIILKEKFLKPEDGYYLYDKIKEKEKSFIFLFFSNKDLKYLTIFVSQDLIDKISANEIYKELNNKNYGKGGGKDTFSSGKIEKVEGLEETIVDIIKKLKVR